MIEQKILIVVEGLTDTIFLRDYLYFLYGNKNGFEKSSPKDIKGHLSGHIKIFEKPEIIIFYTGGVTKLPTSKTFFNTYNDYKMLLIFDTDDVNKDDGGFEARLTYLQKEINEIQVAFKDIFLLPTNLSTTKVEDAQDGDIETLLQSIANQDRYNQFISCYDAFCNCISFSDFITEYTKTKSKIYNYIQVYQGEDLAKKRIYTSEFWNFEHVALNNLKEFLQRHIKVEE
jgi:hypothetical protein